MSKGTLFMFLVIVVVIFGVGVFGFGPRESSVSLPKETTSSTPPANETVKPPGVTSTDPVTSTTSKSTDKSNQKECIKTGCSSQVCAEQEVVTDCMYREEYICYQKATCERQESGECGWTLTPEVQACLLQYE